MTITWARAQDPRRRARMQHEPLERGVNRPAATLTDDEAGTGREPEHACRMKRVFSTLAMASVLDCGATYEVLHFAYDLNLWATLGAKKGLGFDNVPMRILMKGHTCSPLYWQDVHRALIDMTWPGSVVSTAVLDAGAIRVVLPLP